MNKKIIAILTALVCFSAFGLFAQENPVAQNSSESTVQAQQSVQEQSGTTTADSLKYIAAAFAVAISCLAGGLAVGKIGAAAMGAMSENAELSGKALPFVGLAEGICLWGFLVALLIIIL
ncbi:ATP synthase subunit C [Treponema pectinovorum]|uniref:ATP synthase subunit C n=1 Tax=Treponema pectinovorum TaxID=164 RepID=UPI0011F3D086|nr:ATP synthase subunit C [Treponema pectinovorum]